MELNEVIFHMVWQPTNILLYLQALANGFFNFDTFDVDEYEHYEVSMLHLPH